MNIYFAAPLFAKSEQLYNQSIVSELRTEYPQLNIYLPQENATINDKNAYANSEMIALADTQKVLESQLMIAILDGAVIDPGVASEIGVAYAKGIPVLALYTDTRQQGGRHPEKINALNEIGENQFHYLNLYTVGLVKLNGAVVSTVEALKEALQKYLK
ncbi:nucleoside 2-deoxyribosyltransferase [Enterococcus lemanii]|uniref:Nucleoside 2-deoxyribosyltransferase n=1 Tax=Enterococcus lemanii TaxID=1159752 RepID=A0ABV9MUQ3_9ENTE|nr:nucleoside 2-deoxyribosyltransferase [Enterococcus lemanii]MBM7708699.1 nucleoside 2-deoxyribosyltransferase [Enterococcus lemanii]